MWHRASSIKLNHPIDRLGPNEFKHLQIRESAITENTIIKTKTKSLRIKDVLPSSSIVTNYLPPVDDQGDLGACVSCAVAKLIEYDLARSGQIQSPSNIPILSRLYIYWFGRYFS